MSPTWAEERFDDSGILRFSRDGRTLEQSIRQPLKNANWHLIRRLKIADIMSRAKNVPDWQKSYYLDILEQRKALTMYVYEIMSTKYWFGLQYHFPNLVIKYKFEEEGFWSIFEHHYHHDHTTLAPYSNAKRVPSIIGAPTPSKGDDSSTAPLPVNPQTNKGYNAERFRPSFSLHNNKPATDPTITQLALENGVTIDPNYEGELTMATIRDRTCPADQNAAVFIKHVDPAWTTEEILNCIHEGGIYKFSRQEPNEFYHSSAVTLTFKHRRAAVSFLERATNEGIYIKGKAVKVVPSRHPCWGIEKNRERQTRVLQVYGPEDVLDADELEAKLHENIRFTLMKREEWVEDGQKIVNFHFENILGKNFPPRIMLHGDDGLEINSPTGQSRAAALYLSKEEKCNPGSGLNWEYVEDPCAIDGN
ncbi:hypothetical protein BKA64DRAFT_759528 [Cadophora sp. MPI-SDFR-AT-0126]|nr:hypothetical protein BKA64DRAFT_759528 [Leotiomycetes sp. MPI-SDFR-AT-0126]